MVLEYKNFSDKKQFGFILGVSALIYKVICFFMFADSIFDWWGGMVIVYFAFYFTSVLTIKSSLSTDEKSKTMSLFLMILSFVLLGLDFFGFLGFAISLNSTPMREMGFMPFVNLINGISNAVILIETKSDNEEIRIPFEKISFIKKKADVNSFFRMVNVFEIICIIALSAFFVYINDGKEHAYHGSSASENKVVNGTIRYLEKTYSEDINMRSSAGPRGEVYKYEDPDRPGCNTYCVKVFWKMVPITAYAEIKPDGSLEVYKENFQSKRFSYELQKNIGFGCTFLFEDFISGKPVLYDNYKDYFAALPQGKSVDIEISCSDDIDISYKDRIVEFVNKLPVAIEGNLIIQLYYTEKNENIDLSRVSIPYSHQSLYISKMVPEEEYILSHGMAVLLSLNTEYINNEILNAVDILKSENALSYDGDIVMSDIRIGNAVNEYMIKEMNDNVYFSLIRNFYPVIYNGEVIAISRLTGEGYDDWHYEIIESELPPYITENGSGPVSVLYDPVYVYLYNGENVIRLFETDEIVHDRWDDAEYLLVDTDPSTREIEFEDSLEEVELDRIKLTDIKLETDAA